MMIIILLAIEGAGAMYNIYIVFATTYFRGHSVVRYIQPHENAFHSNDRIVALLGVTVSWFNDFPNAITHQGGFITLTSIARPQLWRCYRTEY